jgi:hypothetical protein
MSSRILFGVRPSYIFTFSVRVEVAIYHESRYHREAIAEFINRPLLLKVP